MSTCKTILTAAAVILAAFAVAFAQDSGPKKLTAEQAGEIGQPQGRIAFHREGAVWVMNCDGTNQRVVSNVENGGGRLSFSPDDRMIVFTRSGQVTTQAPTTGEGGMHKVYDLFTAFLDSADAGNTTWWLRLTDDLGSRAAEWSADGSKIVYSKDLNGHEAFPQGPNYQVVTIAPDGSDYQLIRKDWANPGDEFMLMPSMNAKGDLAFVYYKEMQPIGFAVLSPEEYMTSMKDVEILARRNFNFLAPVWSPDGKWIACVSNDVNKQGLYITAPDTKEKYLVSEPPVGTYIQAQSPGWSPDSKWITYATTDGSVWIVDITGNGQRRISGPGLDSSPAWSKTTAMDK